MRIGNSSHLAPAARKRPRDSDIVVSGKKKSPVAGTAGAVTWPPGGPSTQSDQGPSLAQPGAIVQ